jgi:glutathione reductase (NADPH)
VYAIGDVNNKIQLTPVAIQAGRLLMERIFGGRPLKMNYENVPTVVFSHPPIGMIGLSEEAARKLHGDDNVVAYKANDNNMFYSVCEDPEQRPNYFYKLVCLKNENEKVIGLHGCGRGIDEFLQGFGVAIRMGVTRKDFSNAVAIHPTAAESVILIDPKF